MTALEGTLSPGQSALGRHHAYRLFSRLYLRGITADLLRYVQAVPELAEIIGTDPTFDQAAADHHHLFGLNLFPFESIFLDTTGLLGGRYSRAVLHFYQRVDYQPDTTASSPDHIGHEIGLLAHLCRLEADNWQDGRRSEAKQMRIQQLEFLQAHLLRWLLPFITAIRQHAVIFYAELASLTWALTCSHYAELMEAHGRQVSVGDLVLPGTPPLLENEQTGLKEIASYLLTPAFSGVYLSGENIRALAREEELPRGFGGRQQLLLNLMRSAIQYDKLPILLDELVAVVEGWQSVYRNCVEDVPLLALFVEPWLARIEQTIQNLQQIEQRSSLKT